MDDLEVETHRVPGIADAWPTAKQRHRVQQAVTRLLDALAPERAPARGAPRPTESVERIRSPRGCILQGDACAVSVSWFPPAANEPAHGSLQVIAWSGIVSRPGATARAAGGARALSEDLLHPVETTPDAWVWRHADGSTLDGLALAERCLGLLANHDPARPDAPAAL